MDLSYTPDQETLRQSVVAAIAEETVLDGSNLAGLHARVRGDGGAVDTMIAIEELSRALLADGFLETHVIARRLLACAISRNFERELSEIAEGHTRFAIGWNVLGDAEEGSSLVAHPVGDGWRLAGRRSLMAGAAAAEKWIVEAQPAGQSGPQSMLFLVRSDVRGIDRSDTLTIDSRSASDVEFRDVPVGRDQVVSVREPELGRIDAVFDAAIAAHCAEAVGAMRTLLDETISHTKKRQQFDQPLSSFQVLQHRMVDMHLHLATAAAASLRATLSLEGPSSQTALATSAAKITVATACRFVGQNAIQLHGGLGMRDDTPATRYFRRVTAMESEFGGIDWHLARFRQAEARTRSEAEDGLGNEIALDLV